MTRWGQTAAQQAKEDSLRAKARAWVDATLRLPAAPTLRGLRTQIKKHFDIASQGPHAARNWFRARGLKYSAMYGNPRFLQMILDDIDRRGNA